MKDKFGEMMKNVQVLSKNFHEDFKALKKETTSVKAETLNHIQKETKAEEDALTENNNLKEDKYKNGARHEAILAHLRTVDALVCWPRLENTIDIANSQQEVRSKALEKELDRVKEEKAESDRKYSTLHAHALIFSRNIDVDWDIMPLMLYDGNCQPLKSGELAIEP